MALAESTGTSLHVIDGQESPDDAIKEGVRWLVRTARAAGGDRSAIFVGGDHGVEELGGAIGVGATTLLASRGQVTSRGMVFDLLLEKNLGSPYPHGPVLAIWVDTATMKRVEGLGCRGVCVIPERYDDLYGWKARRDPTHVHPSDSNRQRSGAMSDVQQAPDWWLATDGQWYPPERHPNYRPPSTFVTPPETAPPLRSPV